MKKRLVIMMLLLLLPSCGQAETPEEPDAYESLIAATPVAEVEGKPVSPDGRFEVRAQGASGQYISGIQPPESIQIVDRETGEVLWQDMGWLSQSALWSPEGGFLALARTARTWSAVTVFETEHWASWDFTLPDGDPLPEYTFLGEPWGAWTAEGNLDIATRGSDGEAPKVYTCAVEVQDGSLKGTVWEEVCEALPGSYDFDHDGEAEIVELVTVSGGWYALRIRTADGRLSWSDSFAEAHPGWGSLFVCRVDGADYLLRYTPTMYQGVATYAYQLFSFDETGEEEVVREGSVEFDINFGSSMHGEFDPEAIAAFLEEVHSLLEDSELLLTTEGGDFRSGGPGAEFKEDLAYWTEDELYDESKSLEENLRAIGAYWEKMMTA